MVSSLRFLISVLCFASFSSVCIAQDLSKYRDFQFGMTLDSVAKQIQMKTTEVKTIHGIKSVIPRPARKPLQSAAFVLTFTMVNFGKWWLHTIRLRPTG